MNAGVVNEILNKWFKTEVIDRSPVWKKFREELEKMPEWRTDLPEWEKVMAGEKQQQRFCVDCQWLATDGSWLCKRQTISLVTGQPWTLDLACHTERQPLGGCGTEGKFWKQRVYPENTIMNPAMAGGVFYAEEDDGA